MSGEIIKTKGRIDMKFWNMTPHTVNLCGHSGDEIKWEFPSSGTIRLSQSSGAIKQTRVYIDGKTPMIDMVPVTYGNPAGLPSVNPGDVVCCSAIAASNTEVQQWATDNNVWLVSPDSGRSVRNGDGQIVGVRQFVLHCAYVPVKKESGEGIHGGTEGGIMGGIPGYHDNC